MLGGADLPMLEGYTTLGYLAAQTERIRLGLVVTGVTYRHPGLLAKIATTLDLLSGGRSYLGLGAAWYKEEHTGLGVPFPPIAERFERLEEAIQICLQMFSDNDGAYAGKHYQLDATRNVPQPLQQPHPPLLIGGGGERKTLRLVARSTRTPATSPPRKASPASSTSSRCSAGTATPWVATTTRSRRPCSTRARFPNPQSTTRSSRSSRNTRPPAPT